MDESDAKMPDGFPIGMRVLAVDDDSTVLLALEKQLLKCGYKVTVAHHAHEALKLLRANKDEYDLVISDVYMPGMDGFKLLEIVGLEMELPVIMLSVDCDFKSVMKGIIHGAVDYLAKPVRLEELKLIWKHVARRSFNEKKDSSHSSNKLDHAARSDDVHTCWPTKKCKGRKKEKDAEDSSDSDDQDSAAQKKPRVTWTAQLHANFINAVNQLGEDRFVLLLGAFPKKILDIMNESQLTRENVASHLQKYRNGLKKNAMGLNDQHLNNTGTSGYCESSLSMAINEQRSATPSYINMSTSSYFPAQQPGLTTNSYMMKASTQILGCQAFNAKSNQFDFYEQSTCQTPWTMDIDCGPNLVQQLGYAQDQLTNDMFLSNSLINCQFSNELDSEQDLQQFGSCSGIDVEMGAQINRDSLDDKSCNHEISSLSYFPFVPAENLSTERIFGFEHTDDIHAVLKQFQC